MQLIGLLGRSRAGKDTIAEIICTLSKPTPFQCVYIAKPLKDAMANMYGFDQSQLYGPLKDVLDDRYGMSPREICHKWSTHLMKLHGGNFLVSRTFQDYDMFKAKNGVQPFWIVSDVRFTHDCEAIKKRGGIIWKVTRPILPFTIQSESHIDHLPCDEHILNDSTKEQLYKKVEHLLHQGRTTRT